MERAFVNKDEGFACCCWNAPSRDALKGLFEKAGAPIEQIVEVEEMTG